MKRSFSKFEARLDATGLRGEVESRARKLRVSLRELYDGAHAPSIVAARRAIYTWLIDEGKSINEVARLFDRIPSGVHKLRARTR